MLGALALAAQFTNDVAVRLQAADHAAMGPMFREVKSLPGVSLAIYGFGPYLFYIGQLGMAVLLAVKRRVRWWMPVLVGANTLLPLVDKNLIPLSALLLLVAFLPLVRTFRGSTP